MAMPQQTPSDTPRHLIHFWMPIIIFLTVIIIVHALHPQLQHESQALVTILYILFCTAPALMVVFLSGQTFVENGSPRMLLLGSGAIFFSLSYIFSVLFLPNYNAGVTVHNFGFLVSGICFFFSSLVIKRQIEGSERRRAVLILAYLTAVMIMTLWVWAAFRGWLPVFLAPGSGYTILRYLVLELGVVTFAAGSVGYLKVHLRTSGRFEKRFGQSLAIFGTAMVGALIIPAGGTVIAWVVRVAQCVGGICMLQAILSAVKESGAWRIPLERTLQEQEARYHAMLNSISDSFLAMDSRGRLTYVNQYVLENADLSAADALGKTIWEAFPEIQGTPLEDFYRNAMKEKRPLTYINPKMDAGGKYLEFHAYPVDEGLVIFGQDITKRMQAEEALRDSEEKFRTVLKNSNFIPSQFDRELRYRWIYNSHPDFNPQDIIGKRDDELKNSQSSKCFMALKQKVLETEKGVRQEFDFPLSNGTRTYDIIIEPLRDIDGNIIGGTSAAFDITKHKQTEDALKQLNESLEQQVAERTALAHARAQKLQALAVELIEAEERERQRIAELLHEDLQQMLAAARLQLQAAQVNLPNEPNLECVNVILEESIAKSRRLSHELSPPVLYHGSLYNALKWLGCQMNEQFGLKVELQDEKSPRLEKTPLKLFLFRAVQELLFNIVKHAAVKSARVALAGSNGNVTVTVSDQGKGFNKDIIDTFREKAGFGLIRIRERAERMGGYLKIRSEPGQGSSFILYMPVQTAVTEEPVKARKSTDAAVQKTVSLDTRLRVLFADDHKVMRQGLIRLISVQPEIEVIGEAANGREAIELARHLHPDVIVMDISMPEIDGVEATRLIKSEFPGIRIIGLSMFEDEQSVNNIINAGADTFVPKTASSAKLLKAIYGIRK
jgi:PAS domain S-box-containing protein